MYVAHSLDNMTLSLNKWRHNKCLHFITKDIAIANMLFEISAEMGQPQDETQKHRSLLN